MGWFSSNSSWTNTARSDDNSGGWFGMSRRESNHMKWEKNDTKGAVKAKGWWAREEGIKKQNTRNNASRRTQRNNRREY